MRVCQQGHAVDPDVRKCRECARRRYKQEQEAPGPHPPAWLGSLPWMEHAACVGHDPELWFPDGHGRHDAETREARAICATCAVQAECLDLALVRGERYGIWGGRAAGER